MSRVKHTPLPWGVSYGLDLSNDQKPAHYVAGPNPEQIGIKIATPWIKGAWDDDAEARANVEFIVRACNAHYEMEEVLARFVDHVRVGSGSKPVTRSARVNCPAGIYHDAVAALAKSRGMAPVEGWGR